MNEWWERFLSRVPGINDKANDKMHDGFFANSEIGTFSQGLYILANSSPLALGKGRGNIFLQ